MIQNILAWTRKPLMIRLITLGDQCMFAAGNFLLTVLLTRFFTDIDLAAYGIALSIALVLQGVQKNTYVIQNSLLKRAIFRARSYKILGEHCIAIQPILIVLSLLSLWVAYNLPQTLVTHTIIATTVCFAIFSQLEFERIVLIKYEKYLIPFMTSLSFMLLVIGFLIFHDHITFYQLMFYLWIFAALKTALLFAIIGLPDFKGGWLLLLSDSRRNAMGSLQGVLGASGYTHGPVMILGALAAPTQVAAYVAMRSLLQPTQIIMRSLDVIDKNFFHAKSESSHGGVRKTMMSQIGIYFLISTLMAVLICIFGREIIHFLYAGKHEEFLFVLYGWAALSVFMAMVSPLESGIIVKKKLNEYNAARLWIGIFTVFLCFVIAGSFGAYGIICVSFAAGVAAFVAGYHIIEKTFKAEVSQKIDSTEYALKINHVSEKEWDSLLSNFSDATIYQTRAYGDVRWGKKSMHHVVMKRGHDVLALAQITTKQLPFFPWGKFAYIPRGPVFQRHECDPDFKILEVFLKHLYDDFVLRRGYMLRITSNLLIEQVHKNSQAFASVFEKFHHKPANTSQKTLIIDLSLSLEDIRSNLDKTWRSSLSKAERSGLKIVQGTSQHLYEEFSRLYSQLLERKNFAPGIDYHEFADIQKQLPSDQSMQILICYLGKVPINAAVVSAIGNRAIYIMGATDNQHIGANGSYLLQWHIIGWLKEKGVRYYDLGGIDPINNPNVHRFKKGLAGKDPKESEFIGTYEAHYNPLNYIILKAIEDGRSFAKKIKKLRREKKLSITKACEKTFYRAQRYLSATFLKSDLIIPKDFKAVSITFDDFPKAAMNGANILEEFGGGGTFYVCMDLLEKDSPSGSIVDIEDLQDLQARGHEIGCHTFEHLDCTYTSAKRIKKSCERNRSEAEKIGLVLKNFAYPRGGMSLSSKKVMRLPYKTARSNLSGINRDTADAYCLKAMPIYEYMDIQSMLEMVRDVSKNGGWLIFYTHDVQNKPSKYGTSISRFHQILTSCKEHGIPILSVQDCLSQLEQSKK